MRSKLIILTALILTSFLTIAQKSEDDTKKSRKPVEEEKESVVYEKIYDEPYDVYKLWIKFQPLYFDIFMSNMNAGFGFEAQFIEYEKFDLNLSFRKPYSSSTDVYRKAGELNNDFSNSMKPAFFAEAGGSYHIYDDVKEGTAKIVLRKTAKSSKARNRQKIEPAEFVKVDANVREIVGIRGGFTTYTTSINISDLAVRQGIAEFTGNRGTVIDDFVNNRLYGNLSATGFYAGASYSQCRNIIIKPEDYSNLANDILVTTYFDILVMPANSFSNVYINDEVFDINEIGYNPFGFRVGLEGKFNQKFTYSYAFEAGIRPAVKKRGAFALFKLYFPVLATSLKMQKESFESVGDN
jgi:hypothetical protein